MAKKLDENGEILQKKNFLRKIAEMTIPAIALFSLTSSIIPIPTPNSINKKTKDAVSINSQKETNSHSKVHKYGCGAGCDGCMGGCQSCTGGCQGCSGGCQGNCSGGCLGDCTGICQGSCYSSCTGGCSGGCQGSCYGACHGYSS